ncbi:TPA: pyridoxamine 5'-phosphate oxidase [Legionella pneumophila]|uniref:Pyridoxamine 5''-phosphate oxidase n=1 Tax=Legionella fallonii LLAP-10 TaxID=1212491 RepID=A0A098G8J3_9GAMM|nr:pyridoxamine 5'-phosphate oxidase family protein [Legionella fallonii]CEG58299.1 Pyridoxamine 5''-phosphate oxidase [Legionella fallonii LLAP-10]HAU3668156.1 pyridoxamine 5'-phosphate oxidase [Legionella pneumophila]
MIAPIKQLNIWINEERHKGAPNPQQAVLSTATKESIPHARVVAIREISELSLLFFTQKGTRKVAELITNPIATLTFWFELLQREVIIEGVVESLLPEENERYWQTYPREAQIRFYSYAATSSQPIISKHQLEKKKKNIAVNYQDKPLPMSEFYCGFRVKPARMVFYTYRTDELSDVVEYHLVDNSWITRLLSP